MMGLIGPFLQIRAEAQAAAKPVFQLLDEVEVSNFVERDASMKQTSVNLDGSIHFDQVNFAYPTRSDVPVLRDLNIVARRGQTTALIGSSGSGKSNILTSICSFYALNRTTREKHLSGVVVTFLRTFVWSNHNQWTIN